MGLIAAIKKKLRTLTKKELDERFVYVGEGQFLVRNIGKSTVDKAPSWITYFKEKTHQLEAAELPCCVLGCSEVKTLGGHLWEYGHTNGQGRWFHFVAPLCSLHNSSTNKAWMKTKPGTRLLCMRSNPEVRKPDKDSLVPAKLLKEANGEGPAGENSEVKESKFMRKFKKALQEVKTDEEIKAVYEGLPKPEWPEDKQNVKSVYPPRVKVEGPVTPKSTQQPIKEEVCEQCPVKKKPTPPKELSDDPTKALASNAACVMPITDCPGLQSSDDTELDRYVSYNVGCWCNKCGSILRSYLPGAKCKLAGRPEPLDIRRFCFICHRCFPLEPTVLDGIAAGRSSVGEGLAAGAASVGKGLAAGAASVGGGLAAAANWAVQPEQLEAVGKAYKVVGEGVLGAASVASWGLKKLVAAMRPKPEAYIDPQLIWDDILSDMERRTEPSSPSVYSPSSSGLYGSSSSGLYGTSCGSSYVTSSSNDCGISETTSKLSGLKFYKGGQFLPGKGLGRRHAPKGGVWA
jgi:hypothetical protein